MIIRPVPAANPARKFPLEPHLQRKRDLQTLSHDKFFRVALGAKLFTWSRLPRSVEPRTLCRQATPPEQKEQTGYLMGMMALGVCLGSVTAGIWSGRRVEMGLVTLSAIGLVANGILLYFSSNSWQWTTLWLFLLGAFGGAYDVPLMAYLQKHSRDEERGSVFAANNFLTFSGMFLVSLIFFGLHDKLKISSPVIFLIAGLITIPVAFTVFNLAPMATMRVVVRLFQQLFYRVRIYGNLNVPDEGGALLVSNHISWMDAILIGANCHRDIRFIAFDENLKSPFVEWMSKLFGTIPINNTKGPKALLQSLNDAKQALRNGDVVCIFAEGALSRTGQLMGFQRGLTKIIDGLDVPVIPMFLDQMWGSIFSFRGGKFFKKWPEYFARRRVTLIYGTPLIHPKGAFEVRQAVQQLSSQSFELRKPERVVLSRMFIRNCKRHPFQSKLVDSTHQKATGRDILMRSLILLRILQRKFIRPEDKMVGLLLPPSVGGVIANAALVLGRHVPVNLNYTLKAEELNSHLRVCKIKHVLTSRKFVEKTGLELDVPYVYLEELKPEVTLGDKLWAALAAFLIPSFILERILGLTEVSPDDPLTVIFTSGSTGEPKGVTLTYHNVGSNIDAIDHALILSEKDTFVGVLPFFHSFGFTATLWTVLAMRPRGAYHFNPLDARVIGKLCQDQHVTILLATPTFLRGYIKRCDAENFKYLRLVVTGAEKLPKDLSDAFEEKFGTRPLEGYGTTELSPLVSVNIPNVQDKEFLQEAKREGTVGRPVWGVSAKVVCPDTGRDLGVDEPGLLLIKGPNVMQGYLQMPEKPPPRSRRVGTAPGTSPGSTRMDSSRSPIGKAGSQRLAGRWSRTSRSRNFSRRSWPNPRTNPPSSAPSSPPWRMSARESASSCFTSPCRRVPTRSAANSRMPGCRTCGSPAPTASWKWKNFPSSEQVSSI
ncbi:MAG: AMP-binding protein [Planctomycetales bacterium]